ncbi:MAG TPA: ATP-binding cassette domain-containing protein, partial [Peptostreptococcaceae bacterium]|nr:ATP-binding cassette domain-containing protein [Peptostreptococcaceae bacterium]
KDGKAIVYISHRLKEIFEICDDITVLRDGKYVGEAKVAHFTEDKIIEMMVGRKLTEQFPRTDFKMGDIVLEVKNLSNEYVNNISFSVKSGEILGIAGLMGCGRTELAKTIYGHIKKQSGEIYINGNKIENKSAKDGLYNGIAYVSEDRKGDGLILGLSVKENITISSLDKLISSGRIDKTKESKEVKDYIGKMNIKTPSQNQIIKNLSGGNQQKVAIAKALMTNPKVLILDEPTRGVDVGAKKEIYDLINEFKKEGKAVIMISSEMPEILGISDRVLVLSEGRISGEFDIKDASQENIMKSAVGTKEV